MTATPIGRNYSLDAARGILMMLGVILHTANIYSNSGGWLVSDVERSGAFDTVASLIHVFRMPAFFWISGYFCALTFERSGARGLVRKRLPRLVLPLVTAWLTLNIAQEWFLAAARRQDEVAAVLDGVPLYHLWFLVDLLVYIALAALILPYATRLGDLGRKFERAHPVVMILALALLSLLVSVAARATGAAYTSFFGLTSLFRLATYAPFFLVGIYMYSHANARDAFLRVPAALILIAVPLCLVAERYTRGHGFIVGELALFFAGVATWVSVAAVLRMFHDAVKRESIVTRFLSDAAYSVFLFHHILVVAFGFALLDHPMGAWTKFAIISVASFTLSALMHIAVIRPNSVLRLLYNGK